MVIVNQVLNDDRVEAYIPTETSFGIISFQNKESTDVEKDDQDFSIAN